MSSTHRYKVRKSTRSRKSTSRRNKRTSTSRSRRTSRSRKSNSPIFYKRLRSLSPGSRVPKKSIKDNSSNHSDLFTDENPKGTVHGLKFKSKEEAIQSIKKVKNLLKNKKITFAHAVQISLVMTQRSKYHAHPTTNIKEANKVWNQYLKQLTKK